jgi:opacity protein-like surface antigen
MKKIFAAMILLVAPMVSASAQTGQPAANPKPDMPAVTTSKTPQQEMPAKGSNSFTEAQAKSRIEAKGFTNVSTLAKDQDGVWRGKAMKSGTSHDVSLDYQGNVVGN